VLEPTLQMKSHPEVYFAGQITGVEGYVGNMATGLLAGWNAARMIQGEKLLRLPRETMLGALCHYVTHASEADFQPMKANFGVLPALDDGVRRNRRERAQAYAARAERSLATFLNQAGEQLKVSG
jgi:methylenetetrahydrofolate--tRNA-(uracil-5-)-methyltransferase